MTGTLSPSDRIRREWYLLRFSWHMQDYPQKAYRQIKRDLRRELTTAAPEVGMRRAVTDLGHPRVLAEGYLTELGRRLPRWLAGGVAAALAVVVIVYLELAYAIGTLDTLEALGGGTLTRYPFGAETVFTATDNTISIESGSSWQWALLYLGVAAVAFVTGSRLWRAFR